MRIIASAIKLWEQGHSIPIVLTGFRHANIYHDMHRLGIKYDKNIEGFLTDTHKFLDRFDAKKLALENGQFIPWNDDFELAELYSENIWPPLE